MESSLPLAFLLLIVGVIIVAAFVLSTIVAQIIKSHGELDGNTARDAALSCFLIGLMYSLILMTSTYDNKVDHLVVIGVIILSCVGTVLFYYNGRRAPSYVDELSTDYSSSAGEDAEQ